MTRCRFEMEVDGDIYGYGFSGPLEELDPRVPGGAVRLGWLGRQILLAFTRRQEASRRSAATTSALGK